MILNINKLLTNIKYINKLYLNVFARKILSGIKSI